MLATALQIIRADELFYWLTPRLERTIACITGVTPGCCAPRMHMYHSHHSARVRVLWPAHRVGAYAR